MKRLNDTLMGQTGFAAERTAPLINLVHGGQFGFVPDFTTLVSSAPYVKKNLVARLMEAPGGFKLLPNKQDYVDVLKSLIELTPRTIEGIQSGITNEFVEVAVGGDGQMQEIISNSTVARTVPVFTWDERANKPIQAFWTYYSRMLLMDPQSKYPAITSVVSDLEDWLPDMQAFTVLFYETDVTHTKVVEAWLSTNMMPKSNGPNEGRKDLTAAGEGLPLSIEFTAVTQSNYGVRLLAQQLVDEMNLSGLNPNHIPAFVDRVSVDVKASTIGYSEKVAEVAKAAAGIAPE